MIYQGSVRKGQTVKINVGETVKEIVVTSVGKNKGYPIFNYDDDKRWEYVYNIIV